MCQEGNWRLNGAVQGRDPQVQTPVTVTSVTLRSSFFSPSAQGVGPGCGCEGGRASVWGIPSPAASPIHPSVHPSIPEPSLIHPLQAVVPSQGGNCVLQCQQGLGTRTVPKLGRAGMGSGLFSPSRQQHWEIPGALGDPWSPAWHLGDTRNSIQPLPWLGRGRWQLPTQTLTKPRGLVIFFLF